MRRLRFLIFLFLSLYATGIFAAGVCDTVKSILGKVREDARIKLVYLSPQDLLLTELIGLTPRGNVQSFTAHGRFPPDHANIRAAYDFLVTSTLDVASVQRAHAILMGKKSKKSIFRGTDNRLEGIISKEDYVLLDNAGLRAVEENPFLRFVPAENAVAKGFYKLGSEFHVGNLYYPNADMVESLLPYLSPRTLKVYEKHKKEKASRQAVNRAIQADLLVWSIQEAQNALSSGRPVAETLGTLEWRLVSLGLYNVNSYSVASADVLARLIVDAVATQNGKKVPFRVFHSSLRDPVSSWVSQMKVNISGSIAKARRIASRPASLIKKVAASKRDAFETWLMTRRLTGILSEGTAALKAFNAFYKQYYAKKAGKLRLVPYHFIRTFGELASDYNARMKKYYEPESESLWRGASYWQKIGDRGMAGFFCRVKTKLISEDSFRRFTYRPVEGTRVSMARFNHDLVADTFINNAFQQMEKDLSYSDRIPAWTYLLSASENATVATRFAMGEGYLDGSGASEGTFFVVKFRRPKYGALELNDFRKIDSRFRSRHARQKEVSIAGGVEPDAVLEVRVFRHHKAGEKKSGSRKYGVETRRYVRDSKNPRIIRVYEVTHGGGKETLTEVKSYNISSGKPVKNK